MNSTNQFPRAVLLLNGVTYLAIGLARILAPEWFFTNIGNFPPFNPHEGDLGSFLQPPGAGFSTRPGIPHGMSVYSASPLVADCFTRSTTSTTC